MDRSRTILGVRAITILLLTVACGSDVGVIRVTQDEWLHAARRNVLSSDDVSDVTHSMLRRRGYSGEYRQDPRGVIAKLVDEIRETHSRDLAVAIAELGYLQTRRVAAVDRTALGTALRYSYAYLFDPKLEPAPQRFDAQFRWACDIYNAALADLARVADRADVRADPEERVRWYGGSAAYTVNAAHLGWELEHFESVQVTRDYRVANLPPPDVRRGFGVPIVLRSSWNRAAALEGSVPVEKRFLPPYLAVACTVVLRFPDGASVLDAEHAPAVLEFLDPTSDSAVTIEGEPVPIEVDYTTPLAAALTRLSQSVGFSALRKADVYARRGGLYMFRPHRRGRIPILLIHGLASDPYTWMPIYNDLLSNETIRTRCEFIFWFYPTGQPILYSAAQLRAALREARDYMDPDRNDEAIDWTVVCGHSMGGLLARTLVFDSGDALWNAMFKLPFDETDLDESDRELLGDAFFFDALPGINRAIFFASPHRGSPQAGSTLGRIVNAFAQIPARLKDPMLRVARRANPKQRLQNPTSVHGLRPDNPVLIAAIERPINPRVTYHSIIGDELHAGATDGTDGFVPYWSAHLDGAASELVLKSGHSVQQKPRAARETRRILLEHIAAYDARSLSE